MTDVYAPPFGAYAAIATAGNLANFKIAVNANLDLFTALINPTAGSSAPHPDFNKIPPAMAKQLLAEIAALKVIITAGT